MPSLERQVKQEVGAVLAHMIRERYPLYFWMPVPYGYGQATLDYVGCLDGKFFAIETKAPGQWLTPRQRDCCLAMLKGGAKVFIISGHEGLSAFVTWVVRCQTVPTDEHIVAFADYAAKRSPLSRYIHSRSSRG